MRLTVSKMQGRHLLRGALGSVVGGAELYVLDDGTHPDQQCGGLAAVAIVVPV